MVKMEQYIPIPYKVILNKLVEESNLEKEIAVGRARFILRWYFRLGKVNASDIFQEMKKYGWIEFMNKRNIKILINRSVVNVSNKNFFY